VKILFLCASLEPGRDGVGDYTRRLAEELRRRGRDAAILSVNDFAPRLGPQHFKNELRLSRTMPWSVRLRGAREFLEEFKPGVLSLQFVGYGFHPCGLPLGLASKLRTIAAGVPWLVMFHELWIKPGGGLANRLLSRLQKAHLVSLCRSLAPKLVQTSNENYARRLAETGISASVLPLFSNIERVAPEPTLRKILLREFGPGLDDKDVWIFVFFGSIHPGWHVEEFLKRTSEAARKAGKKACLFFSIGKNPGRGAEVWNAMCARKSQSLFFREIGELSAADVSRHLQAADFGVATTPLGLLGKSGSAAAMASHGLSAVVPPVDVFLAREVLQKNGLVPMDGLFEQGLWNPPKPREGHSAGETADLLLQQLQPLFKTP
jgi:glycosyltransferase involved in cell wall biosynthesis